MMGTEQEIREQKYEDYIADVSPGAAAAGRREPYHLAYLKKYGERIRLDRQMERNTGVKYNGK